MTGARLLARDYIASMMKPGVRVLDVCCGDGWVVEEFRGLQYVGMDKKIGHPIQDLDAEFCRGWVESGNAPDFILSIYGLQHMLNEEAKAWTMLRRIAAPTTKFVYVGRPALFCRRETDREDPLNAYNHHGLMGLALASGWRVVDYKTGEYEADSFRWRTGLECFECNAFAALMEPIL
jgi:hypothetical protein